MHRRVLHPASYLLLASRTLCTQPLAWAGFCLAAALSVLSLLWSGAAPHTSKWGVGIILGWATGMLVMPWIQQAVATALWRQENPESKIAIIHQLRAGWDGFIPFLRSLALASFLAPLGLMAFGLGCLAVVGVGLWRCSLASLRLDSGKGLTDRTWTLCGPGGILWALSSLILGGIIAAALVAGLHPLLGAASQTLAGPTVFLVTTLLVTPAVLDRYSSESD